MHNPQTPSETASRKPLSDAEIETMLTLLDGGRLTAADAKGIADSVRSLVVERKALRHLDVEYGRVEDAIIMSDPNFDGDGPGDCGDRLIASVHGLRDRAVAAETQVQGFREMADHITGPGTELSTPTIEAVARAAFKQGRMIMNGESLKWDVARAPIEALITRMRQDLEEASRITIEHTVSTRMQAAGMISLSEIGKPNALSRFVRHAGVSTPEHYFEWLTKKAKEYGTIVAAKEAGIVEKDPEIDDFMLGKSAAFGDAVENARAAGLIPENPEDGPSFG